MRSGRPARRARALRTASSHASKAGRATAGGTVRARWLRRGAWQKRRRRRATWCGAFFNASSLACSRSTLALSATRTGAAWPSGAPRTTTASPLLARHSVHLGGCRTRPNGAPSASAKAITSSLGRASSGAVTVTSSQYASTSRAGKRTARVRRRGAMAMAK